MEIKDEEEEMTLKKKEKKKKVYKEMWEDEWGEL